MQTSGDKPELQELPRIKERLSFIYLQHCVVNRTDSAVSVTDVHGSTKIPAAAIGAILLGPGTSITHRAMELLGDVGASVLWVGEGGIKCYAHGQPLTHSASLLMAQAAAVSNRRSRLSVARKMYQMRFPEEDVSRLTMQQLRGREGSRVRAAYRKASKETGVPWNGREYQPKNYSSGDTVNAALSIANSCLYGMAYSVIVALGCSPGLGFIHTGHDKSFVYDIADLYKTEICVPVAFEIASRNPSNVWPATRSEMRNAAYKANIMERMTGDIRRLILGTDMEEDCADTVNLWDERIGSVENGISYHES